VTRWAWLAAAIACEVTATLALKGALTAPGLYAVVVTGYVLSFLFLSLTLRAGMPLGAAYGIWGAVGVASTAVLSAVFFGEALTPTMLAGIGMLIAGVLCIELGSRAGHRERTEDA
jgi:small multidrug resistance pump